jgi:hypothetical protein
MPIALRRCELWPTDFLSIIFQSGAVMPTAIQGYCAAIFLAAVGFKAGYGWHADVPLQSAFAMTAEAASPAQINPPSIDPALPFGRHGLLTAQERGMAETAWSYFEMAYQPDTGLVNSVGSYPSTTMWDTASYLSGLVAAYELEIIDRHEFDRRMIRVLGTLRGLDLFQGKLPNKAYNAKTGEKVNYANKPGELGYSALDIGRLLVWLKIIKERYPYMAGAVDNVVLRWNFCDIISPEGQLIGATVDEGGKMNLQQEGRLGYEEYAAKGFQLWGFDTAAASEAAPYQFVSIQGVDVPVDGRDPRIYRSQNYVVSEGYILEGLELNWDLPSDHSNRPGVASDGWRAEFADRIYQVQEQRFKDTGILTARSEHQIESAPYFVYDAIFADGYAWNTLDPAQGYQPDRAAVSTKAAIAMWALWNTPYTQLLFDHVASQSEPGKGFDEGIYENGRGAIPLQTANNNGIILAALLYKVQGPILQFKNDFPQVWDNGYADTGLRKARCQPVRKDALPAVPPILKGEKCPADNGDPALNAQAYCRSANRSRRANRRVGGIKLVRV